MRWSLLALLLVGCATLQQVGTGPGDWLLEERISARPTPCGQEMDPWEGVAAGRSSTDPGGGVYTEPGDEPGVYWVSFIGNDYTLFGEALGCWYQKAQEVCPGGHETTGGLKASMQHVDRMLFEGMYFPNHSYPIVLQAFIRCTPLK